MKAFLVFGIYGIVLLLTAILLSLQPTDEKCNPILIGYYYRNGKLITTYTFDKYCYLSGNGISSNRFHLPGNKIIHIDSIVFKIK